MLQTVTFTVTRKPWSVPYRAETDTVQNRLNLVPFWSVPYCPTDSDANGYAETVVCPL